MGKVELTPAKLAELKQKAEAAEPTIWEDSISVAHTVTSCGLKDEAEFIAAADPATVLALVEEIEILKTALNLLLWEYYSTDLEQEDIDKLFKKQIEMAKKYRENEAGQ